MKRSLLAIIVALAFALLMGFIPLPNSQLATVSQIAIFLIEGIIAGYIARRKGWLHGIIAGGLVYLLILIIIVCAGLWLKFAAHAIWTGGTIFQVFEGLQTAFKGIISGAVLGCIGGVIGEKLYLGYSKNKV